MVSIFVQQVQEQYSVVSDPQALTVNTTTTERQRRATEAAAHG